MPPLFQRRRISHAMRLPRFAAGRAGSSHSTHSLHFIYVHHEWQLFSSVGMSAPSRNRSVTFRPRDSPYIACGGVALLCWHAGPRTLWRRCRAATRSDTGAGSVRVACPRCRSTRARATRFALLRWSPALQVWHNRCSCRRSAPLCHLHR